MEDVAGWVAPVATMAAAMMTAANIGARITGWGFVVFTVGSLAWSAVGIGTGQTNLLATNALLTIVNLIGVWRWLGRQRAYEDGGKSAERKSRQASVPSLVSATGVAGLPALDNSGAKIGRAVEALLECDSGKISYVVIAVGGLAGIAETLKAIEYKAIRLKAGQLEILLTADEISRLPELAHGAWPATPPVAHPTTSRGTGL